MVAHTKHIGRYNNERVVVVYGFIPDAEGKPSVGDGHMALVVHPDKLPTNIHQAVMNILVSFEAQDPKVQHLGEVLRKHQLEDGTNLLQTLHMKGWLKKIASAHIILTPDPNNPNTGHRLDEINKLIEAQKMGDSAAQDLKDIDDQAGIYDPAKTQPPASLKTTSADVLGESAPVAPTQAAVVEAAVEAAIAESVVFTEPAAAPVPEVAAVVDEVVDLEDNDALARHQLAKARKLRMDADIMLSQAKIMTEQAYELVPELKPAPRRGRPGKTLLA